MHSQKTKPQETKKPEWAGKKESLQKQMDAELLSAVKEGNHEKAKTLLQCGADANAKDGTGKTGLISAAITKNDALGILLIQNGANKGLCDNDGKTALDHLNAHAFDEDSVYPPKGAVLKAVIENGIENFNPAWFA